MVSLINLFHAGLDFSRHRGEARFLEHVQPEMESLFAAISDEFDILTGSLSPGEKMRSSSMNETFAEFLIEVGVLKSRILPVNRLPRFPRQFTPLGREGAYHAAQRACH